MKYLFCVILLAFAVGVAGPPLYFTHTLTLVPALLAFFALGFCCYLFDPTEFLAFSADMRKSATAWFKKGDGT